MDAIQSINTLDELMKYWHLLHVQQGKKRFTYDGIVDQGRFGIDAPKICFLLEECYFDEAEYELDKHGEKHHWHKYMWQEYDDLTYCLNENIKCEEPWYMWNRVKVIANALIQLFGSASDEPMKNTAVVNIKKSEGENRSDLAEIAKCAKADLPLITKELELIDPDVIVCGRVFDICVSSGIFQTERLEKIYSFPKGSGLYDAYRYGNKLVISMWHPSATFSYERITDALLGSTVALRKALA